MTKPVLGKVVGNIFTDLATTAYTNEELFAEAFRDMTDGDDDYSRALACMNELRHRNIDVLVLTGDAAKGDLSAAETAAMTLATSKPELDGKHRSGK